MRISPFYWGMSGLHLAIFSGLMSSLIHIIITPLHHPLPPIIIIITCQHIKIACIILYRTSSSLVSIIISWHHHHQLTVTPSSSPPSSVPQLISPSQIFTCSLNEYNIVFSVPRQEPAVIMPYTKLQVQIGDDTVLECSASGNPQPVITWEKYGGSLSEGRYRLQNGKCTGQSFRNFLTIQQVLLALLFLERATSYCHGLVSVHPWSSRASRWPSFLSHDGIN